MLIYLFILATNEDALLVNVGEHRQEDELISFDTEYFTPTSFSTNNPFDNQTNNVKKDTKEIFRIVFE